MSWFYEIKDREDRVAIKERWYATREAAIADGNKRAALLTGSEFTVIAGQDYSPVGTWTRNLGYGEVTVTYTTSGALGTGFVHSAKYERRFIVETTTSEGTQELSHSEIEALFRSA
jgi:hypothetical protein